MWDAIVVGLGGVGSFALSSLSKSTRHVVGIEQFARGHAFGSSHGASRIYRRAYFEHSHYVPWIQYSIEAFQALEEESRRVTAKTSLPGRLLQECGTLILEDKDSQDQGVIACCERSAQQHGIQVERLNYNDLRERYPQFQYKNNRDLVGLLEPGGGFIRPEFAMTAALEHAEARGATVWEGTKVKSIREIENESGDAIVQVVVDTESSEDEVLTARSVIVTAGAWAASLIPAWASSLRVTRQLQVWLSVSGVPDSTLYDPSNMPTWYLSTSKSSLPIYGIPADPRCDNPHWIKLGLHLRDKLVSPDDSPQVVSFDEKCELLVAQRYALSDSDRLSWASAKPCLYTMTPDSRFMVGQPAGTKRTFVAAGLSGHGFKMTPALGQMLCDWALDQDTSHWNAKFLSPARFRL